MRQLLNMKKQKGDWVRRMMPFYLFSFLFLMVSCFGGKETTANGGELTGASGKGSKALQSLHPTAWYSSNVVICAWVLRLPTRFGVDRRL